MPPWCIHCGNKAVYILQLRQVHADVIKNSIQLSMTDIGILVYPGIRPFLPGENHHRRNQWVIHCILPNDLILLVHDTGAYRKFGILLRRGR